VISVIKTLSAVKRSVFLLVAFGGRKTRISVLRERLDAPFVAIQHINYSSSIRSRTGISRMSDISALAFYQWQGISSKLGRSLHVGLGKYDETAPLGHLSSCSYLVHPILPLLSQESALSSNNSNYPANITWLYALNTRDFAYVKFLRSPARLSK
jgi:hypothetical protein